MLNREEIKGNGVRSPCVQEPWPGQMRTIYEDHKLEDTYFDQYKGYYFTGDGCRRDEDGYYWITGRVDDVINVSGHRMGTAEVESALVAHESVAEAAVVGFPHEVKGEGIYAYVTLNAGVEYSEDLRAALKQQVRGHRTHRHAGLIQSAQPFKDSVRQDHGGFCYKIATGETDQIGAFHLGGSVSWEPH